MNALILNLIVCNFQDVFSPFSPFFFALKRTRGKLSEKDVETLLQSDTVTRKFIVRREASRMGRFSGLASGVGLLQGIDTFALFVGVVHQVHF